MILVNPGYFLANKLFIFPCWADRRPKINAWNEQDYWAVDADEANQYKCYGIAIESNWLVIDVDLRKPEAHESFARLKEFINFDECFTCKTARGGYHFWFKKPTGQATKKTRNDLYPGIDFLSSDSYVIGPGSVAETGEYHYESGELDQSPEICERLLDELEVTARIVEKAAENINTNIERERYRNWLLNQPPAIEGQNGDDYTYNVAAYGFDFGITNEQIHECLLEWNVNNQPPWSSEDLWRFVVNAAKYAQNARGKAAINFEAFSLNESVGERHVIEEVETRLDKAHPGTALTYRGEKIEPTGHNLRIILLSERYRGLFLWDSFRNKIVLDRIPCWRGTRKDISLEMTEMDWRELRVDLSMRAKVDIGIGMLEDGVYSLAATNAFHPICDWLNTLKWDGIGRFDKLFGSSDYNTALAKIFTLASVYRIFRPGYKFDHMLVLAGAQGLCKSYFVQIMGGEWSRIMMKSPTDRKGLQELEGAWWIEFPELSALKKSDINLVKAFITSTADTYIPMYGRAGAQTFPRICIPVWTLNPTETGFLSDDRNRRFLIVDIKQKIDIDYIKANRDQIYAEAMELYKQGVQPHKLVELIAEEAEAIANKNKQDTYDVWDDIISEWIEKYNKTQFTTDEVFTGALNMYREMDWDKKTQIRIGQCLRRLGYVRRRTNGKSFYVKEDEETIETDSYDM